MPQVDDIRRLWSEGRDVSEIARMTGHDRKTVRKYLRTDDFSPEAPTPPAKGPSKLDPFNNSIKITKRRGYGIRRFSAFRRRVPLAMGMGRVEVLRLTLRDVSAEEGVAQVAATVADLMREIEGLPDDAPVAMSVDVALPDGRAVMLAFGADAVIGACGQLFVEGCCEVHQAPDPAQGGPPDARRGGQVMPLAD